MAWKLMTINPEKRQQRCVITSCNYTFQGYELLLKNNGIESYRMQVHGESITVGEMIHFNHSHAALSVFLKGDIGDILDTLKKCVLLMNAAAEPRAVILYSRLPASWLYRMMLTLVADKSLLADVRVASLSHSLQDIVSYPFPLLEAAAGSEERLTGFIAKGLSMRELDVVFNFFRGVTVKEQSRKFRLSAKTIYTHRQEGLRKLQCLQSWINPVGITRGGFKEPNQFFSHLPVSESEFYRAMDTKAIFPVYQIITDCHKRGRGFEILLRWYRHEKLLKPVDFLTTLHNKNIWLQLTAIVIDAAVRGINKYNGKYYFSVNIPAELASGKALPEMAKKAVRMLNHPSWAENLVFEFAETIDVTRDKTIPETMKALRETGCRLFLDDCFSSDHVMFPVRHICFDGLKLDRDIVDKFAANEGDFSLIKAMQYYTDMTGGACVAEGVDSEEKFQKLVAVGVKSFQGYYLSKAVKENELDRMVRQFS